MPKGGTRQLYFFCKLLNNASGFAAYFCNVASTVLTFVGFFCW